MNFQPFGRHLHNQIVVPLLLASVGVAVIATAVGVSRLDAITASWVDGGAIQSLRAARTQFDDTRTRLVSFAKLISEEPVLADAATRGDAGAVQRALTRLKGSSGLDGIALLDPDGRIVASAGRLTLLPGDRPLGELNWRYASLGMRYTTVLSIGGADVLAAIEPINYGGRDFTVVASRIIDRGFLAESLSGLASAVVYMRGTGREGAVWVDEDVIQGTTETVGALSRELSRPSAATAAALRRSAVPQHLSIGDNPYAIVSAEVLGPEAEARRNSGDVNPDPTGAVGRVAVVVSSAVAEQTNRTTIGLIAFWSMLAVLVLTGLGTVIARRVSVPLEDMSTAARQVTAGDFDVRVAVTGSNEVTELAENFNTMTTSLRDRSESLTKKVLELSTLYEMSRTLGSTLDLDTLLESVLDSAMRIFDVESGYVMLRDRLRGTLELRAWRGLASSRPDEKAIRSSMSEWVVQHGRPLTFNPPADETAEPQVDSATGALAALCVPLVSGDGVIGAIAVGSRDRDFRFASDDVRLLSTIANHVTIAIGNIELFSSLQDAYLATVRSLAAAVDAKDPYTRGHSDKVAAYAKGIGAHLGITSEQAVALEMAAYLHDIGKIGIKESILLKPGRLSDEEYGMMKHHPLIGANILRPVAFPWPIAPVVRHHHEHWDGGGYPAGLKGEEIPLLARVLTVADSYEAMTADRPYRAGRTRDEAVAELRRCAGTQFDPRVVDAMVLALESMDEEAVARLTTAGEDVRPEEVRAIVVAVADGMLVSYRRLGGPRLANNLENEVNGFFQRESLPFSVSGGHLTGSWQESQPTEMQLDDMRSALQHIAAAMELSTGRSLVDHFYLEALEGLSERMRRMAEALDLYERT